MKTKNMSNLIDDKALFNVLQNMSVLRPITDTMLNLSYVICHINEDTETKKVWKFHYLPRDLTDDEKFDIEIPKRRETLKKSLTKTRKILREL